jgi:hypothetical protein
MGKIMQHGRVNTAIISQEKQRTRRNSYYSPCRNSSTRIFVYLVGRALVLVAVVK